MKKALLSLLGFLPAITVLFAQTPPSIARTSPSVARTPTSPAAGNLAGKVTDSATGKPLAGASIFINSTSIGTVSAPDGTFHLNNIRRNKFTLVVSAIGYATYTNDVSLAGLTQELHIRLRSQATELAAVTVQPYEKDGWARYGKIFLANFIGTTPNAADCTIRNWKSLRFIFLKRSNRLIVSSPEPLQIENSALGYHIQYTLETFSLDLNKHIILYIGYPLFREMTPKHPRQQRRWEESRKEAYLGSLRQFIRSLYYDCPRLEHFFMMLPVDIPDPERQRVSHIFNPQFDPAIYPPDSLSYYRNVLASPYYIKTEQPVRTKDIVGNTDDGSRLMYFEDTLKISYGDPARIDYDRLSALKITTSDPILIESDGSFYPARNVLASGRWATTEKICNMVPFDYEIPER